MMHPASIIPATIARMTGLPLCGRFSTLTDFPLHFSDKPLISKGALVFIPLMVPMYSLLFSFFSSFFILSYSHVY